MTDASKSKAILVMQIVVPAAAMIITAWIGYKATTVNSDLKKTQKDVDIASSDLKIVQDDVDIASSDLKIVQDAVALYTIELEVAINEAKTELEVAINEATSELSAVKDDVKDKIEHASKRIQILPVGSIVASTLEKKPFTDMMEGDWILADGQDIGPDYEYSKYIREVDANGKETHRVPDLQGRFLRGYEKDVTKPIGLPQEEAFRSHNHKPKDAPEYSHLLSMTNKGKLVERTQNRSGVFIGYDVPELLYAAPIADNGGPETRPKNVAVNFFIKIGSKI
jgi:hypothetical protein